MLFFLFMLVQSVRNLEIFILKDNQRSNVVLKIDNQVKNDYEIKLEIFKDNTNKFIKFVEAVNERYQFIYDKLIRVTYFKYGEYALFETKNRNLMNYNLKSYLHFKYLESDQKPIKFDLILYKEDLTCVFINNYAILLNLLHKNFKIFENKLKKISEGLEKIDIENQEKSCIKKIVLIQEDLIKIEDDVVKAFEKINDYYDLYLVLKEAIEANIAGVEMKTLQDEIYIFYEELSTFSSRIVKLEENFNELEYKQKEEVKEKRVNVIKEESRGIYIYFIFIILFVILGLILAYIYYKK